jgi:hypothetical protein
MLEQKCNQDVYKQIKDIQLIYLPFRKHLPGFKNNPKIHRTN